MSKFKFTDRFKTPLVLLIAGTTCPFLTAAEETAKETKILEEVVVKGQNGPVLSELEEETRKLIGVAGAANDPLQAIYALPGVTLSAGEGEAGGAAEPVIRGSSPQDNAYYIDLIPVSYIFHNFGNSIFDPHLIHSFELKPAAFSSQYGNATGGVLDVKLREPRRGDLTTTLHTSILSAGALFESGIGDNQGIYASFRRSMIDVLLGDDDDDDEIGIQMDQMPIWDDYQVKYSADLNDNNSVSLIAAGASDIVAATLSAGHELVERDPDYAGAAEITTGFDSQGLVWNWSGRDRYLTSIFSHISEKDNLTYGTNQRENTGSDRYLARFRYKQKLNDNHTLISGLSTENITYDLDFNGKIVACSDLDPECSTVDADFITYQDTLKVKTNEIYLEHQWHLTDSQILTYGLHYGNDDYVSDGRFEPRVRWDYYINPTLSTYASFGQYSQLPELGEMIGVLGNPDLSTIKADHYVLGLSKSFSDSWRFSSDIYYKDMTDIVISSEQDDGAENYSNNATGKAYGIEFLLNKDLVDRWYGWASLSLAKTERTNTVTGETLRFEYDKPILFNLVVNRLVGERWNLGIKWSYQSGGRYTPVTDLVASDNFPDVFEPVYGELNSRKYPAYHRLDFRAEYVRPKNWGHWKFYVDILNVYNRDNVEEYEYAPDGQDLVSPPPGFGENVPVKAEYADGFIPSLGFEWQL